MTFLKFVPWVQLELGKKSLSAATPSAWKLLQKELKRKELISLEFFKLILKDRQIETLTCICLS